jgi:pseudouridine-5'-phosphate glycosidase
VTLAEGVRLAFEEGRPVVALETSVLAQGLPPPRNLEAAGAMSDAVRAVGAEPAWIWVDAGMVLIGFGDERTDPERLCAPGSAAKVARRDLPMALAGGGLGATTVSAALWAAGQAGVEVMATGGIGGVHRGTGDVSADLLELARTPGTVICSGPKSVVDPRATLERLEELGVGVLGYRTDHFPFFLVSGADQPLEHRAGDPKDVAAVAAARASLNIDSALLVCNPVPSERALSAQEVESAVEACEARAAAEGVIGKALTPFLLSCLADRTSGRSLEANMALLQSNAALAAEVARELIESPRRG